MKTAFTKASKRLLSFFLAVIMTVTLIPLSAISAFAFSTSAGQTVDSEYGNAYVGYDGAQYPVSANQYALRYRADGSTYIEPSQIGTRRTKLMIVKNGSKQQALCIEYGVDIARGSGTYTSANYENNSYFNMLPMTAKRGIMIALIYGWQPGKPLPISGINEDDYSLATQEIIWEYQQGIRTSPTTRVNNGNIRADQFYDEIKGRPAEKAYNWILEQMANHAKVPSFTTANRDNATTHTLKYNTETKKYSLTLTDTNNTGVDITATSSSGITVTRNGNKYTFTSNNMITSDVLCEYKKNITLYGEKLLVWGNVGNQTMVTGVADPIRFYANFKTETYGTGKIIKTSEDGKIADVSFNISGNGVNETVKTNAQGVANLQLLPGAYTVTELVDNKYEPQNAQTVTIISGQTSTVTFNNILKRGNVKVTKTAEDGLTANIKFHLYGTSDSGTSIDEYATTDDKGIATFSDILIGTYTIEEVETALKYITPAKQNITVKWNDAVTVSFHNELKRGDIKVIKSAEDNFIEGHRFHLYGTSIAGTIVDMYTATDSNGIAAFCNVVVGSYTIEEIDTSERYIVPECQNTVVEWGGLTEHFFNNEIKRGDIHGIKKDDFGNVVCGALIGLFKTNTTEFTKDTAILTATSSGDGSFSFTSVSYGEWIVKEIEAPTGYILSEKSYPITVDYHGEVIEVEIVNERIRGTVQLTKIDADYPDNKLTGAEFEVYRDTNEDKQFDKADELVGTMNEVEVGIYKLTDLLYGSYFVKEAVAPEGFYLDSTAHYFEIIENGKTVTVENEAGVGFINKAQVGKLRIIKNSFDGNVEGFTFRVTGPYGYNQTFVTDMNGEIVIENLRIGDKYIVSEVKNKESSKYLVPKDKYAAILEGATTIVEIYNAEKPKLPYNPQTGDTFGFLISIMGISIIGIGSIALVFLKKSRKNRKNKKH